MNRDAPEDPTVYLVVVNSEEQYSIWPQRREIPPGWRAAGKSGSKRQCLAHIDEIWKDMRPLSLRKHMDQARETQESGRPDAAGDCPAADEQQEGPALVERLSLGRHRVETALPGAMATARLKECIAERFVPIRFLETRGSTLLGIELDQAVATAAAAVLDADGSIVHLEGLLTLEGVSVRCVVDLDAKTGRGEGQLVLVGESMPR
jgi:uncharacterized protein YbdZ (MbtH family)